jgi:hypothetical protein
MDNVELFPVTEHDGKRGCLLFTHRGTEAAMASCVCLGALPVFALGLVTHPLISAGGLLLFVMGLKVLFLHTSYLASHRDHPWPGRVLRDNSTKDGVDAVLVALILGFFLWKAHIGVELFLVDVLLGALDLVVLAVFVHGLARILSVGSSLEIDLFPLRPGRRHLLRFNASRDAVSSRAHIRYLKEEPKGVIMEGHQRAYQLTPGRGLGELEFLLELSKEAPTTSLSDPCPGYWELRVMGFDLNGETVFNETFLLPVYRAV